VFSAPPRGHPGPVKVTKDQQERTPGILRNYSHQVPPSQLTAGFQTMNFIPTPGKLLPEIQSVKIFLLLKYRPFLHFYSETFGK
jgi:hypothetical protein